MKEVSDQGSADKRKSSMSNLEARDFDMPEVSNDALWK